MFGNIIHVQYLHGNHVSLIVDNTCPLRDRAVGSSTKSSMTFHKSFMESGGKRRDPDCAGYFSFFVRLINKDLNMCS